MVTLHTNRKEYRNDIAEEIMLFLGIVEMIVQEPEEPLPCECTLGVTVLLTGDGDRRSLSASAEKITKKTSASLQTDFTLEEQTPLAIKKIEKRQIKLAVFRLLKNLYPEVETPWGSLTGIRPTKLFRELSQQIGEEGAENIFRQTFFVSKEKTNLAREICRVQYPFIQEAGERALDVYIGIPFCKTRCLYCSFVSEVLRSQDLLSRYLNALETDIRAGAALAREGGYRIRAMYVGGGTPTVLSASQLERLLETAFSAYGGFGLECTVEAGRPDTIDEAKLNVLRRLQVERISINPQTMNDETLRRIGRAHSVAQTLETFRLAREMGFPSINMDVIAGLPGETPADMARTYGAILPLQPENLTVHTLAVKRSSLLKTKLAEYPLPEPEAVSRMVDDGAALAKELGMEPYYMYRQKYMQGNLENVGYAKPGHVCRYNIDMMEETVSILAHGAGSMTKRVFGGEHRIERLPNPKDVGTYLEKLPRMLESKQRFFLG